MPNPIATLRRLLCPWSSASTAAQSGPREEDDAAAAPLDPVIPREVGDVIADAPKDASDRASSVSVSNSEPADGEGRGGAGGQVDNANAQRCVGNAAGSCVDDAAGGLGGLEVGQGVEGNGQQDEVNVSVVDTPFLETGVSSSSHHAAVSAVSDSKYDYQTPHRRVTPLDLSDGTLDLLRQQQQEIKRLYEQQQQETRRLYEMLLGKQPTSTSGRSKRKDMPRIEYTKLVNLSLVNFDDYKASVYNLGYSRD